MRENQPVAHLEVLATLREQIGAEPGVVAAYLYGSEARGDAREGSDLDVGLLLVEGTAGGGFETAAIQGRLERATGREVHCVDLAKAPPDLVQRVLRDGIVLVDRDRARRIAFEVRARNEYWDLKPILDQYRRIPTAGARG